MNTFWYYHPIYYHIGHSHLIPLLIYKLQCQNEENWLPQTTSCLLNLIPMCVYGRITTTNPYPHFLVAHVLKNLPTMQETWVRSLGSGDALEEEMVTHSYIPTWRIPWTSSFLTRRSWAIHRSHFFIVPHTVRVHGEQDSREGLSVLLTWGCHQWQSS